MITCRTGPWLVVSCALACGGAAAAAGRGWQQAAAAAKPAPPVVLRVAAGNLDADRAAEIVSWDSESKALVVFKEAGGAVREVSRHLLADFPAGMAVGDVDADGTGELVVSEGLRGYNAKEGPQVDVRLRIYEPLEAGGWTPIEVYRQATERPGIPSLDLVDLDGDGRPEILFAYFTEKYFVDLCVARRHDGRWSVEKVANVRMGMHVAAGDALGDRRARLVVGRPYGEDTLALGGAFVLDGPRRLELPAFRGVSSVAVGDVTGDGQPDVVIGDGWHSNYGRIARGRIAVLTRATNGDWAYDLLEDVPEQVRITSLRIADVDGDGRNEILAHGERRSSLGGDLRLYQRAGAGWRGVTLARDVQGWAVADADGDRRPDLVLAGRPPEVRPLDPATLAWDARLAEEVKTWEVDAAALVGRPAPRLGARQWFGSAPLSLDALRGKVVLLDFWATWCKPCIATFPTLRRWLEKYGPEGLVIVGVTNLSAQTADAVRLFHEQQHLPWPVAIDPEERTQMEYGVTAIPHSFLIDRAGTIRLEQRGGGDLAEIERQIARLLRLD